uniref:Leucine rich immune protein (Coil-less) n=1 Tax=Anopheles culicifacies TaxID=139723 RepID=A0A2C9GUP2_9DIPT
MVWNWNPNAEGSFAIKHAPSEVTIITFVNLRISSLSIELLARKGLLKKYTSIKSSPVHDLYVSSDLKLNGLALEQTYLSKVWFEENNTFLEKLTISYNRLKSVPGTVTHLTRIKEICITGSRIQSIDFALFAKLQRLENLNLNYNIINDLEYSTLSGDDFPQLRELYLSSNRLTTVNFMHFNGMNTLETLYLSNNEITHVQGPLLTSSLKILNMSANLITTLSCCNWTANGVINMMLFSNKLDLLPTCIEDTMVKVKYLHLASNALSSENDFWARLASMKSLQLIDISYNRITSVVLDSELPLLLYLNLQNNRVTDVSVSIANDGLSINADCNLIAQFVPGNVTQNVTAFSMRYNPLDCSWDSTWNAKQIRSETNELQCKSNESVCKECFSKEVTKK